MKINIYMDDIRNISHNYEDSLDGLWVPIRSVQDVIYLLNQGVVENMSLDHDMGSYEDTGYDLLTWMEERNVWPSGYIVVHSANPSGANRMRQVIKKWEENK